jgi:hypothetical protein
MSGRLLALALLLALVGCGPPRVETALDPVVLAAPDCDSGPAPAGWLVPSEVAIRGGHPRSEPLMSVDDHDKWPSWTSGARSWVLTIPPGVAEAELGVVADPADALGQPVAVQEPWGLTYRPGYAQRTHQPGQSTSIWLYVDLEAWCALDRPPAEAPVWISSDVETLTLWIEFE